MLIDDSPSGTSENKRQLDLSARIPNSADFGTRTPDVQAGGLLRLALLALLTGTITGFGAVAFRALIGFIHNALFLGQFSFRYDANLFTPVSPWGAGVILVPVLGSVVVTFLVTQFAPEARGHGVPEVMDAIYYKARNHPARSRSC